MATKEMLLEQHLLTDEQTEEKQTHMYMTPIGSNNMSQDVLEEEFYINYNNKTTGPYNHYQIYKLYFSSQIEGQISVKNIRYADKEGKWCGINLSGEQTGYAHNTELQKIYPKLYDYLIPKLQGTKQYSTPLDIPTYNINNLSCLYKTMQVSAILIVIFSAFIISIHLIPTVCLAGCCCWIPFLIAEEYIIEDEDKKEAWQQSAKEASFICVLGGFILVPCMTVFLLLINDIWREIQSWMIAYISWGAFAFLFIMIIFMSETVIKQDLLLSNWVSVVFWIIGIEFDIQPQKLFENKENLDLALIFIFPSLAALLPSTVIGFIANFVLEEKFILKCNEEIKNESLCFDNEYHNGCCQVVSSHDVQNMYEFLGGLSSNILAAWAVIRIVGYIMVNITHETSIFARRITT